jgi:hypothetical protein
MRIFLRHHSVTLSASVEGKRLSFISSLFDRFAAFVKIYNRDREQTVKNLSS